MLDYIILYCVILYYTKLYQGRPARLAAGAGKLQDSNSGSCNCKIPIPYYTKVAAARPSSRAGGPGGGSPRQNCTNSILAVVIYAVFLSWTKKLYLRFYTVFHFGPQNKQTVKKLCCQGDEFGVS